MRNKLHVLCLTYLLDLIILQERIKQLSESPKAKKHQEESEASETDQSA